MVYKNLLPKAVRKKTLLAKLIVQRHMSGSEIIDVNYNISILYILL